MEKLSNKDRQNTVITTSEDITMIVPPIHDQDEIDAKPG
jgi:hypothetical protein